MYHIYMYLAMLNTPVFYINNYIKLIMYNLQED